MQDLEPIVYDKELSAFNLRNDVDLFDTNLILEDYDWMKYTLSSHMRTKSYGDIKIIFEYFGANYSTMKVETTAKEYEFEFDTDLFKEHIVKFMQKHIRHWEDKYGFSGIEEIVNFYNAVLSSPRTVEITDD